MEINIDYHNHDRELINDCCKSALWLTVGTFNVIAENNDQLYSVQEIKLAQRVLEVIQDCLQPVLVKPDETPKIKIIVGR
jgi:hypothetical protein